MAQMAPDFSEYLKGFLVCEAFAAEMGSFVEFQGPFGCFNGRCKQKSFQASWPSRKVCRGMFGLSAGP